MSLVALLLVIAAAVCHATWNFFIKRINGGPELIWLFSLVSLPVYGPIAIWLLVTQRPDMSAIGWSFILGSVFLHLAYLLLLQTGYRKGDLSLVYPVARATGPVLSSAFAVTLLGEVISLQMGIGAAIIICGVFFLTGGVKGRGKRAGTSLAFGLGTGVLIGSYTAWDAYAVSVLALPPLLLEVASNLGRAALLTPIAARRKELVKQHWRNHKRGGGHYRSLKPAGLHSGALRYADCARDLCCPDPRTECSADGSCRKPSARRRTSALAADMGRGDLCRHHHSCQRLGALA